MLVFALWAHRTRPCKPKLRQEVQVIRPMGQGLFKVLRILDVCLKSIAELAKKKAGGKSNALPLPASHGTIAMMRRCAISSIPSSARISSPVWILSRGENVCKSMQALCKRRTISFGTSCKAADGWRSPAKLDDLNYTTEMASIFDEPFKFKVVLEADLRCRCARKGAQRRRVRSFHLDMAEDLSRSRGMISIPTCSSGS